MNEIIFTCLRCEANYQVAHLEQPVTECPVCFWKPKVGRQFAPLRWKEVGTDK